MGKKYDIESFCADLGAFLKANLNTKISAINTEKGDSITLGTIDTNAYFFQSLNNAEANYDPYVFYGITDIQADPTGPGTGKTHMVDVMLIMADEGTDANIVARTLRYHRALEEVIEENFASIGKAGRIFLRSLVPIKITDLNTNAQSRACGVQLEVHLA